MSVNVIVIYVIVGGGRGSADWVKRACSDTTQSQQGTPWPPGHAQSLLRSHQG